MPDYDATFKILLLGGPEVDTSGLLRRFLTNIPKSNSYDAIGLEFKTKDLVVDNKKFKLQVWDCVGEERFKFLLPMYVDGARGALFIYDITKETSVAELQNWIDKIKDRIKLEVPVAFPIVVLGNKSNKKSKRQIYPQESITSEKLVGVDQYIECSIRTGENVEKAFEALTRLILTDKEYNLEKTKKAPLEEKLNTFGDVVEKMMSMILRIPDFVDQSLATVNQRISTLESRINMINNEESSDGDNKEGDYYPYPYIIKPPKPPDDFAMAPQSQLRSPLKEKDPKDEIYCQYCGVELTKEEQFTHSCKKKPE